MLNFHEVEDPYDTSFVAVVQEVRPEGLLLDRTLFSPATSVRVADVGHIGGHAVNNVLYQDAGVVHQGAEQLLSLRVGEHLSAEVDWTERYAAMRLHSAVHLTFFAFVATHGPASRATRCVSSAGAGLDIAYDASFTTRRGSSAENLDLQAIRDWVEQAMSDDLAISVLRRSGEGDRRYWHVDGIGTAECWGTHPRSTGEIGTLDFPIHNHPPGTIRITAELRRTVGSGLPH